MKRTPRVLIAPDTFKGSLTAHEVSLALAAGLQEGPGKGAVDCRLLPLADGGDGSVDAALAAGFGRQQISVTGPTGQPVVAAVAFDGSTAVVEVANSCGLALLSHDELAPLDASSRGFGEVILHALALGPRRIVLALGGSASTDGGMGMLSALGYTFHDAHGTTLHGNGRALHEIDSVEAPPPSALANLELVLASDVRNPLLGPDGAARVFGPQKGAGPEEVSFLEAGLAHLVDVVEAAGCASARAVASAAGSGSAGGLGFACALLGARQVSGAEFFLDLLGFDDASQGCDVIITGEGSIDEQTLAGKLPAAVARRAGVTPVLAVVGRSLLPKERWSELPVRSVYALTDYTDQDSSRDPRLSAELLRTIGQEIRTTLFLEPMP
ncbi:glycerate kinase [Arthrobacter echini]|uniref:glycerate kinase n=1 Tax=Arthrobacter echini TaxID=1529066 RepID=UPI001FEC8BE0|nr:glycerate kinase [Arthrobacter echini]